MYRAHFPDGSTRLLTQAEVDALRISPYGNQALIEPIPRLDQAQAINFTASTDSAAATRPTSA